MENTDEILVGGLDDVNSRQIILTTKDNPYDPFTQPKSWANWDMNVMGYNTWGEVVEHALLSENLSPVEEKRRINHAISELLETKYVVGTAGTIGEYCLAIEGETTPF